jgi:hypothetical protein
LGFYESACGEQEFAGGALLACAADVAAGVGRADYLVAQAGCLLVGEYCGGTGWHGSACDDGVRLAFS